MDFIRKLGKCYKRVHLVLEHMLGGSLQDRLDNHGVLSIDEAASLIAPVAQGLGFAHTTGIVHKDIKPANILISATGVPKLSDFGVASVREATGTSQIAFSLAYTAPETFDAVRGPNGEMVDPRDERSDLYSLAVTLYAIVTGKPPFQADSQTGLMRQILIEPPPLTASNALDDFFRIALAKHPDDRYSTTTQFVEALTVVTDTSGTSSPRPSKGEPNSEAPEPADTKPMRSVTTVVAPPGNRPGEIEGLLDKVENRSSKRSIRRVGAFAAVAVALISASAIGAAIVAVSGRDTPDASTQIEPAAATPNVQLGVVAELDNGHLASTSGVSFGIASCPVEAD